jgi:hypothetical protein
MTGKNDGAVGLNDPGQGTTRRLKQYRKLGGSAMRQWDRKSTGDK